MKAKISEIFKSIQGEGLYQGQEQVFVRFYGCNIHCSFCDTKLSRYEEKTVEEVLTSILSFGNCDNVSLTGGEPLLDADFLKALVVCLKEKGKIVHLETNGIIYENLKKVIDFVDIIAMDFKLPSSTMLANFWNEHEEFLKISAAKKVFVKVVIGQYTQEQDIYKTIEIIKSVNRNIPVILQPENPFGELLTDKLLQFEDICLKEGIVVKTLRQLHKILGVR